ncbi:SMI1/KNR4 family protein [Komagataeibacter xylinus]|uniref:SMI1/KNR4 family protein n=1 Tax=Komagataeibacter xylinus TaxID=28448 RepID=UPI000FDF7EB3|nr:SMI1/KNR4 family protein [Komagataeibacter xylinus]AZV39642.1 hypothetical protein CXP35_13590 [Komagataeibacter xylinus]
MIDLGQSARIPTQEDIASVEKRIGASFDPAYREFIAHHNGARPDYNTCTVAPDNSCGIDQFLDIADIAGRMLLLADDVVSALFFPFAEGESSNCFMMRKDGTPGVWFYDHEMMGMEALTPVAPSLNAFLPMLLPRDTIAATLKPGQVKSVWSDPDFVPVFHEK